MVVYLDLLQRCEKASKGVLTLGPSLFCRAMPPQFTAANCAVPKHRFIRHLCRHVNSRHTAIKTHLYVTEHKLRAVTQSELDDNT